MVTRTPLTALISLEHALVSELFGSLSEELPQLSNTNLKALFLAHEKKKGTREKGDGSEGERREERGREGREEEIMTEHFENGVKGEAEKAGCEVVQNEAQLEEDVKEEKGTLEEVVEKEEEAEEEEMEVVERKEEGGKSFWQPYLDSLPPVLHTTLFFTEDDLHHLQTSMVTTHSHLYDNY